MSRAWLPGCLALGLCLAALVAVAAQPGARSETGLRANPAHGVLFGFNDDWVRPKNQSRLTYARAAGTDVIRFPVSWQRIEPQPGSWHWSRYDNLYAKALARGIRLIFTPQDSPCWAHAARGCDLEGGVPPDREHLDDWAEFVRRFVERYPRLAAVEVWNEQNLVPYWQPRPQPKRYAELLGVTYRAVNQVDPKVPVLFGGQAGGNLSIKGFRLGYMHYFRRAMAAGARRKFDGLAIHSYNSLDGTLDILVRLRAELREFGRRKVPLWVTETGFSSHAKGGEDRQAKRLRASVRGISRAPGVRSVILHRMFDVSRGVEPFNSMGMVRRNGTRKPAFCAVANLGRRSGCFAGNR